MISRSAAGRGAWLCRVESPDPGPSDEGKDDGKVAGGWGGVRPECLARLNDKMVARSLRTTTEGRLAQLRNALAVNVEP